MVISTMPARRRQRSAKLCEFQVKNPTWRRALKSSREPSTRQYTGAASIMEPDGDGCDADIYGPVPSSARPSAAGILAKVYDNFAFSRPPLGRFFGTRIPTAHCARSGAVAGARFCLGI